MTTARKALVLGGQSGLLGQALVSELSNAGWQVTAHGRQDADVLDFAALERYIESEAPDVVFNTVAYTQVDKAEDEQDAATRLNKALPAALGRIALNQGLHLVHYSTDFIFSGHKESPYTEEDLPEPQSVYGSSKLAGEQALLSLQLPKLTIIRTSWLFGPGRGNFVQTILGLCGSRPEITVVHDQTGSPTYTPDLAHNSRLLIEKDATGIFHIANGGQATWCELAAEAVSLAQLPCQVRPIPSSGYPQKAKRPAFSVLDTSRFTEYTGVRPRPWIQALRDYIFQHMCSTERRPD
ncbi:dTDP-4-dehydrorhamnose reductase [Oleidesulfovibrio sp.]|uniref:dTDP-4-dehydrorhamnose reductase n=1 Tax=Oleidesulfovibrio sp. TaxID=2909707 RepID=UPI003A8C6A32